MRPVFNDQELDQLNRKKPNHADMKNIRNGILTAHIKRSTMSPSTENESI